jgi:ATP-dependent protease ClpP protease subunit/phage head maturation protease
MPDDGIHVRRMADLIDRTGQRIVDQATADGVALPDLPAMKVRWYSMRAEGERGDGGKTEASVYVYDEIGGSFGVTASQFAADLEEIDAEIIHLRINSPGGSVKDALAIMNTLRAHPARVISHVDGWAVSAASVVMLGGDEIVVEPGGEVMTHMASTEVSGQPKVLRQYATWLDRQSENVAELYAQRSGKTMEEWIELMEEESWFYGQEAVDIGLADRAETLTRPTYPDDETAERMQRSRHILRRYRYSCRAEAGPAKVGQRKARAAAVADRAGRSAGVTREVRDAAQMRRRAMDRGLMRREQPAGVTTMSRRSAPSGEIAQETVEFRGRQMFRTHGAFTVYGRGYEMWDMYGPYVEKMHAGAGQASINMPDVDCIFLENHTGTVMARTAGPWNDYRGTLRLEEQASTAWHEAFHNPTRVDIQKMISAIDDKLITEMSFAFLIVDGRWNDDLTEYDIFGYDLHRGDVSAVNYGANPFTDITARAAEILDELEQMPAGAIGEAVRRLGRRVDAYERILRGGEVDPERVARIAEPALVERSGREPVAERDQAMATEWASKALDSGPSADADPDSEQDESEKIVDTGTPSGPTVAGYEAMLESLGVKVRP